METSCWTLPQVQSKIVKLGSIYTWFVLTSSSPRELALAVRLPFALNRASSWICFIWKKDNTEQNRTFCLFSQSSFSFFCHVWKSGRISATLLRSWFLLSSLSLSFFISSGYCLQALNASSMSLLKAIRDVKNRVPRCVLSAPDKRWLLFEGKFPWKTCGIGPFCSWLELWHLEPVHVYHFINMSIIRGKNYTLLFSIPLPQGFCSSLWQDSLACVCSALWRQKKKVSLRINGVSENNLFRRSMNGKYGFVQSRSTTWEHRQLDSISYLSLSTPPRYFALGSRAVYGEQPSLLRNSSQLSSELPLVSHWRKR